MENTKDIIIGNIYRPPYDNNCKENINSFTSELDPILSSFDTSTNDLIVTGDFNINLLQVNMCNKEHNVDFLDLVIAYSLKLHSQHGRRKTVALWLIIYLQLYLQTTYHLKRV